MVNKRSMPNRAKIAEYWKGKEFPNGRLVITDSYEPSCWACGRWWQNEEEKELIKQGNFNAIWNHSAYLLERCHIIPKALGGSNDVDNLFLMCPQCHESSPDTTNRELFFDWVMNRTFEDTYKEHWISDLVKQLSERNIEVNDFYNWYEEDRNRFNNALMQMNTHGFKMTKSTYVAGYLSYYLENAI